MDSLVADFIEWMTHVPPFWAYLIILGIAYGENVMPPIPGDLIVVFGGYLVGVGKLNFLLVVLLATIGGALGFMTMFWIGTHIGEAVLDPKRFRWLPKKQVYKARAWLKRYGYGVVAANRFLSGARSVISLTVGMAHMDAWKTAAFATLSAAVWTGLITYAGYAVGENWPVVSEYLRQYGRVILILLGIVVVIQGGRFLYRKKRGTAPSQDQDRESSSEP